MLLQGVLCSGRLQGALLAGFTIDHGLIPPCEFSLDVTFSINTSMVQTADIHPPRLLLGAVCSHG